MRCDTRAVEADDALRVQRVDHGLSALAETRRTRSTQPFEDLLVANAALLHPPLLGPAARPFAPLS
jgi:hypothetical protein